MADLSLLPVLDTDGTAAAHFQPLIGKPPRRVQRPQLIQPLLIAERVPRLDHDGLPSVVRRRLFLSEKIVLGETRSILMDFPPQPALE